MAKRQQSDRLFRQVGRHGADSQSLKVPIVVAFRAVVVRDQMNADRAEGWECLRIGEVEILRACRPVVPGLMTVLVRGTPVVVADGVWIGVVRRFQTKTALARHRGGYLRVAAGVVMAGRHRYLDGVERIGRRRTAGSRFGHQLQLAEIPVVAAATPAEIGVNGNGRKIAATNALRKLKIRGVKFSVSIAVAPVDV